MRVRVAGLTWYFISVENKKEIKSFNGDNPFRVCY